jgi:hypothetical protein
MWLLLTFISAGAAPPLRIPEVGSRVWAGAGWDPTWVVEVGAGRTALHERVEAHASLLLPVALLPSADGLELGLGLDVLGAREGWRAEGGTSLRTAYAHSELGSQLGLALDLWLRPGRELGPVVLAADLGLRQGLATRFWHSEGVLALGPSVHDGWLAAPVCRIRAGAVLAWQLSPRVGLGLSGGYEQTPTSLKIPSNPSVGQLPFTLAATWEYRWPRD